jgi:hypothetical protein
MRKHYNNKRHRSPRSEIARLQEALKRERDPVARENLKQHIEHWHRTQNNRS